VNGQGRGGMGDGEWHGAAKVPPARRTSDDQLWREKKLRADARPARFSETRIRAMEGTPAHESDIRGAAENHLKEYR
jgi:hypothetical protein